MKKTLRETQTLRAGCSKAEPKIFAPSQTAFPGALDGLEMVTTFTYKPSLVRIAQFRVIVVTDPPTHTHTHTHSSTYKQTGPITIHCAAASAQCTNMNTIIILYISLHDYS